MFTAICQQRLHSAFDLKCPSKLGKQFHLISLSLIFLNQKKKKKMFSFFVWLLKVPWFCPYPLCPWMVAISQKNYRCLQANLCRMQMPRTTSVVYLIVLLWISAGGEQSPSMGAESIFWIIASSLGDAQHHAGRKKERRARGDGSLRSWFFL